MLSLFCYYAFQPGIYQIFLLIFERYAVHG